MKIQNNFTDELNYGLKKIAVFYICVCTKCLGGLNEKFS